MNQNEINDKRLQPDFKGITFSGFKKNAAKKELLNNLQAGNIEPACYWSAEFICAGHIYDLWEFIFLFVSKNIHLGNPKLPIYIDLRYQLIDNIISGGYENNEFKLRNNIKVRETMSEVIAVLCLSKKKNKYNPIKIKEEYYNITTISYRLKADSVKYAEPIFKKEDPKELFVAINEFIYSINLANKDYNTAFFWLEWIIGYEDLCKKNGSKSYICARRNFPVNYKIQKDTIWILWDCLFYECKTNRNEMIYKILLSLQNLFCYKYKPGSKKRRKYILYFSISLLTENLANIKIINDEDKATANSISKKINIIYRQIKKNEQKPSTDYLFNNSITKGNLDKTIDKLDKLNSMGSIVPRNK